MNNEARRALQFCRNHDWGQNAKLENGRIANLLDQQGQKGQVENRRATVPATLSAVREFGGY